MDSGKVVIWNMAPVISRKAEADENIPKMLCQMDNHEGKHHYKFSMSRKYLQRVNHVKFGMLYCKSGLLVIEDYLISFSSDF